MSVPRTRTEAAWKAFREASVWATLVMGIGFVGVLGEFSPPFRAGRWPSAHAVLGSLGFCSFFWGIWVGSAWLVGWLRGPPDVAPDAGNHHPYQTPASVAERSHAPADANAITTAPSPARQATTFLGVMPVLKVADLRRSLALYTGVLGFAATDVMGDDDVAEYCFVRAGAFEVLLSTGSHLGGAPAFTGTLYFRVVGVRAFFEKVRDRAEIVWPLEAMGYGTLEFGVRDPDGYILAFAESAEG